MCHSIQSLFHLCIILTSTCASARAPPIEHMTALAMDILHLPSATVKARRQRKQVEPRWSRTRLDRQNLTWLAYLRCIRTITTINITLPLGDIIASLQSLSLYLSRAHETCFDADYSHRAYLQGNLYNKTNPSMGQRHRGSRPNGAEENTAEDKAQLWATEKPYIKWPRREATHRWQLVCMGDGLKTNDNGKSSGQSSSHSSSSSGLQIQGA